MPTKNETSGQPKRSFIETARRAQIVQAAIETIAELGYANASLARIAERAGISKGVISYHFAGKDDLIDQIVTEAYAGAESLVKPRLEAETTAAGKITAYIDANVTSMHGQRQYVLALIEIFTNARNAQGGLRYDIVENQAALSMLEDILRMGQRNGEFRGFSTRVMAIAIQSAVDGAGMQLTAHPDLDLDHYSHEVCELFDLATRKTA